MSWDWRRSVGFAVELETTSQFVRLRDTGTGRKLVLLNPNGANRLTIRAGQNQTISHCTVAEEG